MNGSKEFVKVNVNSYKILNKNTKKKESTVRYSAQHGNNKCKTGMVHHPYTNTEQPMSSTNPQCTVITIV